MSPLLAALLLAPAPAPEPLAVRASEALVPCAAAAGRAFERASGRPVAVQPGLVGTSADALVASGIEMTRAIEGGAAVDGSEVSVARIPWVLVLPTGNPAGIRGLSDLDREGVAVEIPAGAAAYEAKRALDGLRLARVREQADAAALRRAAVALVPLSIAGPGERVAVDVPALVAEAALAKDARHAEGAREFLRFLGSETGRKAFASCGTPQ